MGLIPEDIIKQVIERSDIAEVIAGYLPLKRAGRNFKANCPFHQEKTPSFVVNPDKQIFHCFGCGVGGNVVAFVMKHDRLEFPEAVRMLAEKANIVIPETQGHERKDGDQFHKIIEINGLAMDFFHKCLLFDRSDAAENARTYLKSRQISLETVKSLKIGFAPDGWDGLINHLLSQKIPVPLIALSGLVSARQSGNGYYDRFRNRVMFPIVDVRGQCRAFGGRTLNNDPAKYVNSPETPVYVKGQHVFGLNQAKTLISDLDEAVMVEGYMDCVMPHQFGFTHVVAALGTALTPEQIRQVSRYTKNVILLFDADPAGQAAMMRSLDLLVEEGINARMATLAKGEDPDSFLRKYGPEAFRQRLDAAQSVFDYKFDRLIEQFGQASLEARSQVVQAMLPTIRRFRDQILQAGYLKTLSDRLRVSEEAVMAEFKKHQQSPVWNQPSPVVKTASSVSVAAMIRGAEGQILKLMMEDRSWIAAGRPDLDVADFQYRASRWLAEKIFDAFDRGQEVQPAVWLNDCQESDVREYLTALLVEENSIAVDKLKMFQDCLQRMKADRRKVRRQELLKAISQAEKDGDEVQLQSLQKEFSQLMRASKETT